MPEKKTYETPTLTIHGDMAVITQANVTGSVLDADFARGTHLEDLTVS